MGCCQSNEVHDGKARNEEIDNQIKRDKLNMRNEVKMLLLGTFIFFWEKKGEKNQNIKKLYIQRSEGVVGID